MAKITITVEDAWEAVFALNEKARNLKGYRTVSKNLIAVKGRIESAIREAEHE